MKVSIVIDIFQKTVKLCLAVHLGLKIMKALVLQQHCVKPHWIHTRSLICLPCTDKLWLGRLNIHSVHGDLCRGIIHCHIAIIYEWQQRYDRRCGRVNLIPEGQWQGLGEEFIIADFIDVLRACLCVSVVNESMGRRNKDQARLTKCTVDRVNYLCLLQLLWCILGGSKYAWFTVCLCVFGWRCVRLLFFPSVLKADSHNCVVNNMWQLHISVYVCVSVIGFPKMERGKDLDHWCRAT